MLLHIYNSYLNERNTKMDNNIVISTLLQINSSYRAYSMYSIDTDADVI